MYSAMRKRRTPIAILSLIRGAIVASTELAVLEDVGNIARPAVPMLIDILNTLIEAGELADVRTPIRFWRELDAQTKHDSSSFPCILARPERGIHSREVRRYS